MAADGPRRAARRRERRRAGRVPGARGPVRDPPPGVRPRRAARGGAAGPGQPPRPARPHPVPRRSSCRSSRARWFGPGPADDLLAFLAEGGHVRQADDGRWYWSSENFPASEVSLRAAAPENVVIIDTTPDRPRVLGEVDLFCAQVLVHEHAIYMHESVAVPRGPPRVGRDARRTSTGSTSDHYTYANRAVTLKPLDVFATAPATGGTRVHGEVMVASLVTLYKKLKFVTDENVGWGPIDLPEIELQTTAYWLTAEAARGRLAAGRARRRAHRRGAGDPGRRRGPADGRPAGPRAGLPGPLTASRGTHRLPVRGDAGWRRASRSGCARATRSSSTGAAELIAGLSLRGRVPGLHGAAPGARRGRQGAGAAAARLARVWDGRAAQRGGIAAAAVA